MRSRCVPLLVVALSWQALRLKDGSSKTEDDGGKKGDQDKMKDPVVQEATELMMASQSEAASARRYAASLGTYGIEEATLKRLSAFAEQSEKSNALLHQFLAKDTPPLQAELIAIANEGLQ